MRVAFFGQSGPYAPIALRGLLAAAGEAERDGWEIALVVEGRKERMQRAQHRLLAPAAVGATPLPDGEELSALATAAGIPVLLTADVNAPGALGHIRRIGVDLIVCVGFDRLFRPELLALAPRGGLNAHPSALPALRGPAPIYWAVRSGADHLALTLHGLDAKEDHGLIYAQETFPLIPRASTEDIYRVAGRLAGRLLVSLLPRAARAQLVGVAQDHTRATRAPRPRPEDSYFDPAQWKCEPLLNFVNVAPFCRTAWTRFGEDVFFIRRAAGSDLGRRLPAQYAQQGARLFVQCADGVAELEIQV